ncbi:MAG: histidinol dehydrogenase [Candidatus Gracilibacteria bacterium]|nr:histidinol dehydrogenase [Candidatus Gracilibacteria bacterium]MDQ7022540.1 histidinol dehydrogenase [Candidatus Gracilibacteria bacterium]
MPTSGYAKSYSGVGLESFGKWITFQELNQNGIKSIGKSVELMAEAEGLQAHKNTISLRIKSLDK